MLPSQVQSVHCERLLLGRSRVCQAFDTYQFSCNQKFDERAERHTSPLVCGKNIYQCFVWDTNDVVEFSFSEVTSTLAPVSRRIPQDEYKSVLWSIVLSFSTPVTTSPTAAGLSPFDSLRHSGCKLNSRSLQLLLVTVFLIILAGMIAQLLILFNYLFICCH